MDGKRNEIATIVVDSADEENQGVIIVSVFDKQEIGLCVSQRMGGDLEIWLDKDQTNSLITALKKAVDDTI
ncbi:hypothetical protein [Paenibacillus glacialis]|uniref:Uncharacterized protein n=1 Tax=Paenibacillus glacialis TaxID=494026 RepID=A0A168HRJ1_9BACL|nr:hypothetical protein [Paenibacillus glacialis]OAB38456.1 hypothetical protein PGLA_20405 [Paenibacillus glacialis]